MAFDVNALSEQVKLEDGFKLATKAVTESKLAQALISSSNFQAGVITKAPILKLSTDVVFQKQGCGRTAIGDTTFTEKFIDVASLAVYKDICYKTLEGTYMAQALAKGDDPEHAVADAAITKQILDNEVAQINRDVEILLFMGDTALTGSTNANLNKIDGIKKQLASISATTVSGATVIEKLMGLYMAMPEADKDAEDAYIFVSKEVHDEYKGALWGKNMFHPEAYETLAAYGTKLFVSTGLKGREVYAGRLSNMQLGFNGSPETTGFDLWYSKDDNIFKQNTYFSVGISIIFPEDFRKATV